MLLSLSSDVVVKNKNKPNVPHIISIIVLINNNSGVLIGTLPIVSLVLAFTAT